MRQVTFLIMLCSSVMAFAQKAYLSVTVNPIDAITESTLTQARVSLISTIDSTEVDTFRRITILGDVIKRYTVCTTLAFAEDRLHLGRAKKENTVLFLCSALGLHYLCSQVSNFLAYECHESRRRWTLQARAACGRRCLPFRLALVQTPVRRTTLVEKNLGCHTFSYCLYLFLRICRYLQSFLALRQITLYQRHHSSQNHCCLRDLQRRRQTAGQVLQREPYSRALRLHQPRLLPDAHSH